MKLLFVSARSATVLLDGNGDYSLPVPVSLSLNGADLGEEKRSVISLFGLLPDSEYTLSMRQGQTGEQMTFRTEPESFTLDVRRFGAVGDGETLCTQAFANAIDALSKKGGGRLVVPRGIWHTGPIVLQSNIDLHLEMGAVILFAADETLYPLINTSFEGLDTRRCQSPLSGRNLHDVAITGRRKRLMLSHASGLSKP